VGACAWPAVGQEIWQIQGSGMISPYRGQQVSTTGNIVTAAGSGVFFIQTPTNRSDGDPWTSDGVYVEDPGGPVVAVGDRVAVSGTVVEHYGQTQIGGDVSVVIASSGHQLPDPVELDAETPTPHQPWPETELERFEGMRINVANGFVTGPTDEYGDAQITASGQRAFREPGIEYPGLPGLPVWDGNPEVFELDPDGVGEDHAEIAAGSRFSARGVLAFAFGSYQLWPTKLEVWHSPELSFAAMENASRVLSIASQNLERLARTGGDLPFRDRLGKLSLQVREVLGGADIVAVQEVDSLAVLEDLADRIAADEEGLDYTAHLIEGNDPSGIDVGFLTRQTVDPRRVLQIGADVAFSWDGSLLFDRPPLVLDAMVKGFAVTVVVVHQKSLGGVDDPGSHGERVRRKRYEQSEWLARWLQDRLTESPEDLLAVIGDFNAFEFSDGYVDVMGQITGRPDPAGALLPVTDVVDPPLDNAVFAVPAPRRYSYIYRGSAEVLDHVVVSRALAPLVRDVIYSRGNSDAPASAAMLPNTALRSSDHDGLVVYFGARVRSPGGRRQP
jgi:predicted extracellular nuclease